MELDSVKPLAAGEPNTVHLVSPGGFGPAGGVTGGHHHDVELVPGRARRADLVSGSTTPMPIRAVVWRMTPARRRCVIVRRRGRPPLRPRVAMAVRWETRTRAAAATMPAAPGVSARELGRPLPDSDTGG